MWKIWLFILVGALGCEEKANFLRPASGSDGGTAAQLPAVNTGGIVSITEESVIVYGSVTYTGGVPLIGGGVCFNTTPGPTITSDRVDLVISPGVTGAGAFSLTLTDLTAATTYYLRAFAVNPAGTAYGKEITFTTR